MADPEEAPAASDPAEESGSASSAVGVTSAAILAAIAMDKAEAEAKPKTAGDAAHRMKSHPGIAAEIEALKLAQAAAEHRSPAALRALVIQTLCEVVTNPMEKGAVRVNAAKVLGTVTEVAAFTERKEVRTISSSDDTRARIMAELRSLMLNSGEAVDIEALSLLDELQTPVESPESRVDTDDDNTMVFNPADSDVDSVEGEPGEGAAAAADGGAVALGSGGVVVVEDDPTTPRPPACGCAAPDSSYILFHSNQR